MSGPPGFLANATSRRIASSPRTCRTGMLGSSQPLYLLEPEIEDDVQRQHHRDAYWIAVRQVVLRHALEVHAVDSRNQRGNRDDGRPSGELFGDLGLVQVDHTQVDLDRSRLHFTDALDGGLDTLQVV